ncbi:polysaccharide biosynthesis/export family protein [Paraburkholderia phymatum]|uniref:Polysaccharide export protein n=2 Tax=Paraburkholderia phymatum TaxID=148447 RepID=B2JS57_PARP8|nr:polysaccharide export protein [Paraburkholderia phymatum STM815]
MRVSGKIAVRRINQLLYGLLRRASLCVVVPLALTACVMAPGMQMGSNPTLPVSVGNATTPASDVKVPIRDIDISLIEEQRIARSASVDSAVRQLVGESHKYTIGPGDVLQITVWDHPELAAAAGQQILGSRPSDPGVGFVVDQRGNIQFPYVGKLHVADLAPDEAQDRLLKELSKAYRDPQVTLRVASFRSKAVYVEGEVKAAGLQPLNDVPMTLLEAVNRAGGFTADADQGNLTLLRDGILYHISLSEMLDKSINPSDIHLRAGDLLRVAARSDSGIFVMGEVNKPAFALPMKTGRLTLGEALAQAGSINLNSADAQQMYVVRGAATNHPEVFHLNAESPVAMTLANEFQLEPKDVVYVDGNGLVRFSRVLSLLLPSYNAGMAAAYLAR